MEAELKCRNTASSASGLSFARCWLRAEAVGMEESSPQKSSSSWLISWNKKRKEDHNPDGISGRLQE